MKKQVLFTLFLSILLCFTCIAPISGAELPTEITANCDNTMPMVVDEAGILADFEIEELTEQANQITIDNRFAVVIVTVDSLEGQSAEARADDYFDYNGYGYGPDNDGILFLLAMEEREWHISTTGYGITAFTDAGIEAIGNTVVPYLRDGAYYDGFCCFLNLCADYLTQATLGDPYDVGNLSENTVNEAATSPLDILKKAGFALIFGLVLALILGNRLKKQMITVRQDNSAENYLDREKFKVTREQDRFLYANIVTRHIERDKGGSSTHTGSSGTSHGGGGGRF